MEKPLLLSIIIPVYNRQDSLDLLLSDLSKAITVGGFKQSVEVIVIDDCSSKPVALPIFPFTVLCERNNQNSGAPFSREKGFKLSHGKFIHFHDSDDSIADNWLSGIVNELGNQPDLDLLMTARFDQDKTGNNYRSQKYFHKQTLHPDKIKSRLIYRNCMGPLGGVTFSRRVLEKIEFKRFSSCQDWQMYLNAIKYSKVFVSRPDIQFIFNKTGDDRISHNPRKKILGYLQLAKLTAPHSVFKKNIRLFYLYTCKQYIFNKGGNILLFYKKNRLKIILTYLVVSVYWRLT